MSVKDFVKHTFQPNSKLDSPLLTTPTVMHLNGWITNDGSPDPADNVTWVYGSATSFAVAGDLTGRYTKGTRISYNDGATDYGTVYSVSKLLASPLTGVSTTISTDVFNKTAHGMANGTPVTLSGLVNTTGTGLGNYDSATENTHGRVYYVVNQAANTFKLALTVGGTAIDLTGADDSTVITVTGATLVTLFATTAYSIANATLTSPRHSYAASPQGYTGRFAYTPTINGFGTITFSSYTFSVIGNTCTMFYYDNGTSTATTHTTTAPSLSASGFSEQWATGFGLDNTSTIAGVQARLNGSSSNSIDLYKGLANGTWTASGGTSHRFQMSYQY
jgi:hypothetical protein